MRDFLIPGSQKKKEMQEWCGMRTAVQIWLRSADPCGITMSLSVSCRVKHAGLAWWWRLGEEERESARACSLIHVFICTRVSLRLHHNIIWEPLSKNILHNTEPFSHSSVWSLPTIDMLSIQTMTSLNVTRLSAKWRLQTLQTGGEWGAAAAGFYFFSGKSLRVPLCKMLNHCLKSHQSTSVSPRPSVCRYALSNLHVSSA